MLVADQLGALDLDGDAGADDQIHFKLAGRTPIAHGFVLTVIGQVGADFEDDKALEGIAELLALGAVELTDYPICYRQHVKDIEHNIMTPAQARWPSHMPTIRSMVNSKLVLNLKESRPLATNQATACSTGSDLRPWAALCVQIGAQQTMIGS